jgi:hypothetical protein
MPLRDLRRLEARGIQERSKTVGKQRPERLFRLPHIHKPPARFDYSCPAHLSGM